MCITAARPLWLFLWYGKIPFDWPIDLPPFASKTCAKLLGQHRTKIAHEMRRQIFCQIKQKPQQILGVFARIFVKYGRKYASKACAKPFRWSLCSTTLKHYSTQIVKLRLQFYDISTLLFGCFATGAFFPFRQKPIRGRKQVFFKRAAKRFAMVARPFLP